MTAVQSSPPPVAELAGSASPLLARLGPAGALPDFAAAAALLGAAAVRNPEELLALLAAYRGQLLFPLELPVIAQAAAHAAAGFSRELTALDRETEARFPAGPFREASRAVGRVQLERLRPLRDVRVVRRCLQALDSGASPGLHVTVYGLLLATFSLPLRSGLAHYAQAAHGGLARAGAAALGLDGESALAFDAELAAELPARLAEVLPQPGWLGVARTP
ncbi:MAG: urease accessory UreF family protein [Limisphaerales bacterium]